MCQNNNNTKSKKGKHQIYLNMQKTVDKTKKMMYYLN